MGVERSHPGSTRRPTFSWLDANLWNYIAFVSARRCVQDRTEEVAAGEGENGSQNDEPAPAEGDDSFFREDQEDEHRCRARRHRACVGSVAAALRQKAQKEYAEKRTERHAADLERQPQDA